MTKKKTGTKIVLTLPPGSVKRPIIVQIGRDMFIEVVETDDPAKANTYQIVQVEKKSRKGEPIC